jgi:flagellar biosynthesis protein FlhA
MGTLHAITLAPGTEQEIGEGLRGRAQGVVLAMDPGRAAQMVQQLSQLSRGAENENKTPVLLVAGPLRLPLRRLLSGTLPNLPVLSFSETTGVPSIETVGQVSHGHELAA